MIVQTAPEGAPRFIITMAEHTSFAGQLARVFGNDRFEPVEPREEMLYLIDHHDHGRGTALFLVTFIPDIALALPRWLGL